MQRAGIFFPNRCPDTTLGCAKSELGNMNSSTEDKVEGAAKEAVGTVKEKTGSVLGNPNLQDKGTAEKVEGKVQQKVGDVKKVFEQ